MMYIQFRDLKLYTEYINYHRNYPETQSPPFVKIFRDENGFFKVGHMNIPSNDSYSDLEVYLEAFDFWIPLKNNFLEYSVARSFFEARYEYFKTGEKTMDDVLGKPEWCKDWKENERLSIFHPDLDGLYIGWRGYISYPNGESSQDQ